MMKIETTAGTCPASLPPLQRRLRQALTMTLMPTVLLSLLLAAWYVRTGQPYTSGSELGYWLGFAGGSLMLILLIYPLRKRFRVLAVLGPLKYWFRFHMFAGITGPVIVLFHSTFHVGSFNAAIALASMLLVVASGIVGRYLYRKIHNGLYGSRATATELQQAVAQQLERLQPILSRHPEVAQAVADFSALVGQRPQGFRERAVFFVTLGWRRWLASRCVHNALDKNDKKRREGMGDERMHLQALATTIDDALQAVQRTMQFSTYERLFALWHVIHIPFLCMLVVTAIVHVVAVHAY